MGLRSGCVLLVAGALAQSAAEGNDKKVHIDSVYLVLASFFVLCISVPLRLWALLRRAEMQVGLHGGARVFPAVDARAIGEGAASVKSMSTTGSSVASLEV